ncbi:MAG: hypothetical protein WCN98_08815, partial [Verrucomicrobiaceae bacterium]
GWFRRPEVSELESFFTRLFFALIVLYTLRMDSDILRLTTEPNPVGLLKLLKPLGLRLTWLADAQVFETWRWIMAGLLGFYVTGLALPLVLPVLTVMHILPFTLFNSQGYTHHGNQIVSLLLTVQSGCVLWQAARDKRISLRPPDVILRGWLLWQSVTLIAGTYFVSVITKLLVSKGMWVWKANFFALDMIKTERQTWLNRVDHPWPGIPPTALWMLDHPWTARIVFGSGIVMEALCILAIGNRTLGFLIGISLIIMHRSIDQLMGGVAFQYNELLDFTFFVGVPFGIAWVLEKTLGKNARRGLIVGALAGVPLSWFFQSAPSSHIQTLPDYFLCLINSLGVWASQDWHRFFEFTAPVFITCAITAAAGIAVAILAEKGKNKPGAGIQQA